jgi:hypothetical protein
MATPQRSYQIRQEAGAKGLGAGIEFNVRLRPHVRTIDFALGNPRPSETLPVSVLCNLRMVESKSADTRNSFNLYSELSR